MRFHSRAGTYLFCCLALLLAAGIWQRAANPSLEYHLEHAPVAIPEKPIQPPAPGMDTTMRLTPEDAATLGQAMKTLRDQPNNPESLITIADMFTRYNDWANAAHFLQHAATAAPGHARLIELAQKILATPNADTAAKKTAEEVLQKTHSQKQHSFKNKSKLPA